MASGTIHVTLSTEFRHHFSSLRAKHDPTNPLLLYKSHQNDYILDSRGHELLISGVKISEHFEEKERQRSVVTSSEVEAALNRDNTGDGDCTPK